MFTFAFKYFRVGVVATLRRLCLREALQCRLTYVTVIININNVINSARYDNFCLSFVCVLFLSLMGDVFECPLYFL